MTQLNRFRDIITALGLWVLSGVMVLVFDHLVLLMLAPAVGAAGAVFFVIAMT